MTFADFQNIYDFTLIECAVQKFFAAVGGFVQPPNDDDPKRATWVPGVGNTAFYTAFQAATFQKARPRVYIAALKFSSISGFYEIDANGSIREKAWEGQMHMGVVTGASYKSHTTLRSQVLAMIPQAIQISADGTLFATGGVNANLQYHQLSKFNVTNNNTTIKPEENAYESMLMVDIAFSVLPSAWPAGMQTITT